MQIKDFFIALYFHHSIYVLFLTLHTVNYFQTEFVYFLKHGILELIYVVIRGMMCCELIFIVDQSFNIVPVGLTHRKPMQTLGKK